MEKDFIELKGVRVNNLKGIDLKIPKNKLVVICGISGSGKSSLAFDTIYAEGQRRYLESLSSYARQFLGGLKKPDVNKIEGLSPTIAVNQKTISSNPRSTVGTITEIYDYLRLLFAHIGKANCPECNQPVSSQTPHQISEKIYNAAFNGWISIFAPIVYGKKGEHKGIIEEIYRDGWPQVRIDGILYSIEEAREKELDKNKPHNIDVLVDRTTLKQYKMIFLSNKNNLGKKEKQAISKRNEKIKQLLKEEKERILDSVKKGLQIGKGRIIVFFNQGNQAKEEIFSQFFSCSKCNISFPEIEPRLFSFNSPYGACDLCQGLGILLKADPDLIISPSLSINEGAVLPWFSLSRFSLRSLNVYNQKFAIEELARKYNFSLNEPFFKISEKNKEIILYGEKSQKGYEGIIPRMEKVYHETDSDYVREEISKYMREIVCPKCRGARLKRESLSVKIKNKNIYEIGVLSINECLKFFEELPKSLSSSEQQISQPLTKEIIRRLNFLIDVGVEYINLAREATSLSVGENQRIRLACQLGSSLSGVIYVLDEPTIGLHQRDINNLVGVLRRLVEQNNTVIVVEHDRRIMESADWIIEIGPGAGRLGGKVVFEGKYKEMVGSKTITGLYLSNKLKVQTKKTEEKREFKTNWLELHGANQFNLKNVDLKIPLEKFVCVVGVSGSGKSTLIIETLAKALMRDFYRQNKITPGNYVQIKGTEFLNKVVLVDQSPIGKTPRSNPATYTGVFTPIRKLFAQTNQARIRGYNQTYFSFNTKLGRCPACAGEGFKKVEMYFLPDIYIECDVCKGRRFTPEVLNIQYNSKNISEVLDLSIEEAKKFFSTIPAIKEKLQLLCDVGLGYLNLGQSANTLSGGESQRIKLAYELSKKETGKTIYILDEPTVGLHFDDIKKLLNILRRLVQRGNSVLVIEHNPDVIKESDWIIELGPDGGENGGRIVFEGKIDELKKAKTWTAKFIK